MSRVKTYFKYVVKRSVGGKSVLKNEDGTPQLGEVQKTNVRITPEQAELLNHGWDSTQKPIAFYWAIDEQATNRDNEKQEVKKAKSKTNIDKLTDQNEKLLAAELENKTLKIEKENEDLKEEKQKAPTKKELVAECDDLGIDATGNVKELKERLANHKS